MKVEDLLKALASQNLVSKDPEIVALEMPARILAQILKQDPQTREQGSQVSVVANANAAALESTFRTLRRKLSAGGTARGKKQVEIADEHAKPVREELNRQRALGVPDHRLTRATLKALQKSNPHKYSLWYWKRVDRYKRRGK